MTRHLGDLVLLPWQAEVMRHALGSSSTPIGIAGGRGSAKSMAVCAVAAIVAATRPGAEVLLGMDTHRRLEDVHLPILSRLAAATGGVWRASSAEIRWPSGSVVRLRHLETHGDPRLGGSAVEGGNYHAVIADECQSVDRRYWQVFNERARVPCRDLNGFEHGPSVMTCGLPVDSWWCVETLRAGGLTWRPKTSANPHNGAGYEDRLRATMTERMARAMLDGEEMAQEGQIVEEFVARLEPDGSLTDWAPDFAACRTLLAMDLGANNPHALLLVEDALRARWVVWREWYSVGPALSATGRRITVAEFCGRINRDCIPRRMWTHGSALIPLDEVVADPAGGAVSAQTGHSDLDALAGARPDGLGLRPLVETVPERRSVMGSLNRLRLAIERKRLMFGRAMIEAGASEETGRSLAKSLAGYRWDPRGRDEPLKDDIHDHACFPRRTPILMADGSRVPIAEVRAGDMVATRQGPRAVVAAECTGERRVWFIRARRVDRSQGSQWVLATPDHPFFCAGRLRPARDVVGYTADTSRDGEWVFDRADSDWRPTVPVFNLTVEGEHEYCAGGFWVSNCDALRYGARRVLWHIIEAEPDTTPHVIREPVARPPAMVSAKRER